jgi:hypothetical protein
LDGEIHDGSPLPDAGLIVYFFIRGNLLKQKHRNEKAFPLTGIAAPSDSPNGQKSKNKDYEDGVLAQRNPLL